MHQVLAEPGLRWVVDYQGQDYPGHVVKNVPAKIEPAQEW